MADGIRFPDDMIEKPAFVNADKFLISDSQDSNKAKWYSYEVILAALQNIFARIDISNIGTSAPDWQDALSIALLKSSINSGAGLNAFTLTSNGIYLTTDTTTNLPSSTNKNGILTAYVSDTIKILKYQTYYDSKVEEWNNYNNGTSWSDWTKLSSLGDTYTFENAITETSGTARLGGALTAATSIDMDGYSFTVSGDDSELTFSVTDTVNERTASITIGANISIAIGEHAVVLESTGISVSNPVKIEGFSLPPGNNSAIVTTTTVYYTDVDTDNLPDTTLAGILEAFYIDSSNAQLIYTTYTDGQIEIWGREKADGTWDDWAQITSGGEGTLDHAALTSNLPFTDSGHTGTANTIAGFDGSGDAQELDNIFAIQVALAQKDTEVEADTAIADFNAPEDCTLIGVFITVSVAPVGSAAIWDINLTGTGTILSTKITIDASEYSSLDAGTQPVLSTTNIDKGDIFTVDCDQTGATTAPQNPVLTLLYRKR
jgi:hypothetical protein